MDRRTLLAAAAAIPLAGCSGGDGEPASPKPPRTPARSPSARPSGPPDFKALARGLDGRVILPGDADYGRAARLYNTRFDSLRPAAVAYVKHAGDVAEALAFARTSGVTPAIRSGGHSYAGYSSGDGRLIVDVSGLARIEASGDTATVGAGARLGDVYEALAARGRTIPAGSCPTVGIAGLTLGGGHGVVSRAYGLTCDSLTGATIVTADGRTLDVSADEHDDLFWALRGGGNGNFGVVTELRFRTHPASAIVSCWMTWDWSRADRLLRTWQLWGPRQPDEIWSALHLGGEPGAAPSASVLVFSLGSEAGVHAAVDRLADQAGGPGPASSVNIRSIPYIQAMREAAGCARTGREQCHLGGSLPGQNARGVLGRDTYAARSDFFDRPLDDRAVGALLDRAADRGADRMVQLTALGGAVNEVAADATAFVHRGSGVLAQYIASWEAGRSGAAARRWLAGVHGAMRGAASGAAYQNYTDADLGAGWREAYFGVAAGRLGEVKRKYDPQRLFDYPQAV
ncbi:putative FAD-linked oxidoreductase YvdP [Streptomyces sp. RB5]|uniref:Putative FAD-linked oxidoreductase YvdP n=1 Tax=Streptomyces smaragdinus TaxID=2585196 RepID=A0A7K0CNT9_9ACTN|nr:FAD-binding oxidoreductase [Streptomyces smaragdinus]MQY14692.1 putative FAD-linked oxidoreductase YvdP [Streptomyces smaragdinus]